MVGAGRRVWWCVGLCVLWQTVLTSTVTDTLPTIYMENHCQSQNYLLYGNTDMEVEDSIVVELTADPKSAGHLNCIVTFAAKDPGHRIMLHFLAVDINYNPGTADRLRIYDGYSGGVELTPERGLYGKYAKGGYQFNSGDIDRDYLSAGSALMLYFVGDPSPAFSGFKALLTVFKDPGINGMCDSGYFSCDLTSMCIKDVLRCNGYDNCGLEDNTDSRDCNIKPQPHHSAQLSYSTNLGLMVGCAVSIVILMVVVLWLGIVCLKKTKWMGHRRHHHNNGAGMVEAVDGAVVEPSEIRRVMSPPVSFLEPPPLYSEHPSQVCGPPSQGRFELPPPYSVDERDTAGLLLNESRGSDPMTRPDLIPPEPQVMHPHCIRVQRMLSSVGPYQGFPLPMGGRCEAHGAVYPGGRARRHQRQVPKYENDIPEYVDNYNSGSGRAALLTEESFMATTTADADLDAANGNVVNELLEQWGQTMTDENGHYTDPDV